MRRRLPRGVRLDSKETNGARPFAKQILQTGELLPVIIG